MTKDKYYSKEAIGERIRTKLRPTEDTGIQKLKEAIKRRGTVKRV